MRSTRPLRLCACRWHRVAVSVDGGMVTLVADCERQLPILAQGPRFISTAGLTVLGTQDLGEETFEVAFQGLGFPHSSVGKESACNAGDPSSIPGLGRSAGEGIGYSPQYSWAFPVTQLVKNRLQCGRPGFDPWVGKIPWRRERLPSPVFWPGGFHGLYSAWDRKESDTTE